MSNDLMKELSLVDQYPDEVVSDKWRIVVFSKNGQTLNGDFIWPSEAAAMQAFSFALNQHAGFGPWSSHGSMRWDEVSHAIPMPVKS